jgi:hypothetical protein
MQEDLVFNKLLKKLLSIASLVYFIRKVAVNVYSRKYTLSLYTFCVV